MNLELNNFLSGLRESIERLRTPVDPISIQGTSRAFRKVAQVEGNPDSSTVLYVQPPSDGYNRLMFCWQGQAGIYDAFLEYVPQEGEFVTQNAGFAQTMFAYALHNPLTGTHINPAPAVWYVVEIPDRNMQLTFRASTIGGNTSVILDAVFWRQY